MADLKRLAATYLRFSVVICEKTKLPRFFGVIPHEKKTTIFVGRLKVLGLLTLGAVFWRYVLVRHFDPQVQNGLESLLMQAGLDNR